MTIKQRILKVVYPVFMLLQKRQGQKNKIANMNAHNKPLESFYGLQSSTGSGKSFSFESLKGHYVLLVNTASECGYTPQYAQLEELHQRFGQKLKVIGFPANDFGGQEPGADAEIERFCQVNFGVTFPLMQKAPVSGANIQPVYQWLTSAEKNGWNSQLPTWNFCKYLVSPSGELLHFFPAGVSPLDESITNYLI